MSTPKEKLAHGLEKMGLAFDDQVQAQLIAYLGILQKWNAHMNLTGHQSLDKMVTYHLLDSLSVLPFLQGKNVLDIGSGAGLPGIPLAIVDGTRNYTLVDARNKRVQFLRTVCRELNLSHVTPLHTRIEDYQPNSPIDTVTARAVSNASNLITMSQHLIAPGGQWLLMKGQDPASEMEGVSFGYSIEPVKVPTLIGQRHIVIVQASSQEAL